MTLNGRYALCCRKDASFGAHHKTLNEGRPILSAAEMYVGNDSSFWQYNIYANSCGSSPGRGRQTTVGLSRTAIFSVFASNFFGYFRDEASVIRLLYGDMQSVVGFSVIPYAWPCMTLTGYFALNCFCASLAGWDHATSKNNCIKTNKDRHILSLVQIVSRDCTVCPRSGSLERRR